MAVLYDMFLTAFLTVSNATAVRNCVLPCLQGFSDPPKLKRPLSDYMNISTVHMFFS